MSIKVTCSSCSSDFNLNDSLEGKKVRCSKCKNIIEVIKQIEPETEELNDNKEENISSEFNLEGTSSLNDGLIDNSSDNNDFFEKSMDIGEDPKKATLINKKIIIVFIIILLLGAGVGYSYKTGLLNNYVTLNSAKEMILTGSNVTETGSNITETGSNITETGSNITETGSNVTETGSNITETGSNVTETGSNVTETGSNITETGSNVTETGSVKKTLDIYAKNSKRTQDLNNLAASINIKSTMGVPLQSLVIRNEKYEGKNMYVGGVKLVGGINYFTGTPNYVALGVRPEDFKNPNGEEYKIGLTTLKGGVFEILGYIENGDGIKTAKLNGTYNANDTLIIKAGKDYEIIGDNVIKIIPTYINRIQRNDIIGGNKVLKISPDGSEITFQQKFDKKIIFLIPDTKGLISVDGSVIKDGDIK